VPLIFVTGISGAGKSTVREELSRRGFAAYDTDEDEIAHWTDKVTGKVTRLADAIDRTPEFLARHDWNADPERVSRLAAESGANTVFLCGSVGNDDEVMPYFKNVFLLSIDEATMRRRLLERTTHDFGTKPHELDLLLAWRSMIEDQYLGFGAIVVDATRPPALVVDEILRLGDVSV
jgi:broad-specificity NMP kinase